MFYFVYWLATLQAIYKRSLFTGSVSETVSLRLLSVRKKQYTAVT